MSDTSKLTKLGSKTKYPTKPSIKILEIFENQHEENDYVIPFECFEGSSLCPKTGQPDLFKLYLTYIPNKRCVESKSLKLYIFSFRNYGSFMEDITNRIGKDIVKVLNPKYLELYADFNSRGGIYLRPFFQFFDEKLVEKDKQKIRLLLKDYVRTKTSTAK